MSYPLTSVHYRLQAINQANMSKNTTQGIQSGKKDQSEEKGQKTGFMSLNSDVLACVAGFLNITGKAKLAMVHKCTADVLSRPHAWDGTLTLSYTYRRSIQKILTRMPNRTWIKKMILKYVHAYYYMDEIAMLMSKCPMLQHLDLTGGKIKDDVMKSLAGMQLQHLNLSCCHNITNAGLQHLAGMPLQHLDLTGCHNITNAGLQHLTGMPLQYLGLACCSLITNAGLQHLASMRLQHLDLSYCKMITDADLQFLVGMQLQHLDLSFCKMITDAGLQFLTGMQLQHLNLKGCNMITSAGLQHIADIPLQDLYLSFCSITSTDLRNFPYLAQVAEL